MICILNRLFKQVGFTLLQATKALRDSRGIAYSIFDLGTRRDEGSASRLGRTLPPGKIRYPFYRRLCGPQGRSGQVRKISPPPHRDSITGPSSSRYTDHATRPTLFKQLAVIIELTRTLTSFPCVCCIYSLCAGTAVRFSQ